MRRLVFGLLALATAGGAWYYLRTDGTNAAAATSTATPSPSPGRSTGGGRAALTVDAALVSRHEITEYITVVGNLIGEATVDVAPRVGGRIASISVKMGDRVAKGQPIAKMEDNDIREQVNQANANLEVNKATITARESDQKAAEVTLARTKSMFE